jgi:hypothetical protein
MTTIRNLKSTFEETTTKLSNESRAISSELHSIESQINSEKDVLNYVRNKIWTMISENKTPLEISEALVSLLDLPANEWIQSILNEINSISEQLENSTASELEAQVESIGLDYNKLTSQLSMLREETNVLTKTQHDFVSYEIAEELIDILKITEQEIIDAPKYKMLSCIFSPRKSKLKKLINQFDLLSKHDINIVYKEYTLNKEIISEKENLINELRSQKQNLRTSLDNAERTLMNRNDSVQHLKSIQDNSYQVDYLYKLFSRYELNDIQLKSFAEEQNSTELINTYSTAMAKQNMLLKISASMKGDVLAMNNLKGELDKHSSKLKKAASRNGSKSVSFDTNAFEKQFNSLVKRSRVKSNWYRSNSSNINNYNHSDTGSFITWFVIYNSLVGEIAFADEYDQSGALLMFSDEMSELVDGVDDFSLDGIELSELSELGDIDLSDIDSLDMSSLDMSSLDIDSQISSISDSISEVADTSYTSSCSSTTSSCGGGD